MFDEWFPPRYPERKRVVVNTQDDRALRGILWTRNRDYLVLKSAELLQGDEIPISIDGDVVVQRENVSFIQVLYGAS